MKTSTVPLICGFALTAMSAATLSHWWSLQQFVTTLDAATASRSFSQSSTLNPLVAASSSSIEPNKLSAHIYAKQPPVEAIAPQSISPAPQQKEFYEALISKMQRLETQNRDMLDQLAETNRDVMKLEFRVDTHSESFRPLPVTEDRPFTRVETDPSVLPPRAEPVINPLQD